MTTLDNIFNQLLNKIDHLDLQIVELALQNAYAKKAEKKERN